MTSEIVSVELEYDCGKIESGAMEGCTRNDSVRFGAAVEVAVVDTHQSGAGWWL